MYTDQINLVSTITCVLWWRFHPYVVVGKKKKEQKEAPKEEEPTEPTTPEKEEKVQFKFATGIVYGYAYFGLQMKEKNGFI